MPSGEDRAELETHLSIFDGHKGDFLLYQGVREMEQYFILDGILKLYIEEHKEVDAIVEEGFDREWPHVRQCRQRAAVELGERAQFPALDQRQAGGGAERCGGGAGGCRAAA